MFHKGHGHTHAHSHTVSHIHTSNTWNKHKLRFIKEQLTSKEEVGYTVLELSLYHREGIAEHTEGRTPGERSASVVLLFTGKWDW